MSPPDSGELTTLDLRCVLCERRCTLTLPATERLDGVYCPTCCRPGGLRRAAPRTYRTEPTRAGKYDPPDDVSDEELLRRRPWRAP